MAIDVDDLVRRVAERVVELQHSGQEQHADLLIERVAQRVLELQRQDIDQLARRLAAHLRARAAAPPRIHDPDKAAADLLARFDK